MPIAPRSRPRPLADSSGDARGIVTWARATADTPPFDPHEVEIKRAATVVVLRESPELEVLMLRRNSRSIFVANMWLYPGGAVDDHDASPEVLGSFDGLDAVTPQMDLPSDEAAAHWVAVVRETVEEAGLLLGSDRHRAWFDGDPDWRDELNHHGADFVDAIESTSTRFDVSGLAYLGRFITPLGAPRRYDTRFFACVMPDGQHPSPDTHEAVDLDWVRPAEALERLDAGNMEMVTPTIAVLMRLAKFERADDVVRAAATSTDEFRVRLRPPGRGRAAIAFPEDADYDTADERAEYGAVRI